VFCDQRRVKVIVNKRKEEKRFEGRIGGPDIVASLAAWDRGIDRRRQFPTHHIRITAITPYMHDKAS
jgi:hypothetical protein